jgi:hypothetical protein
MHYSQTDRPIQLSALKGTAPMKEGLVLVSRSGGAWHGIWFYQTGVTAKSYGAGNTWDRKRRLGLAAESCTIAPSEGLPRTDAPLR